MVQISENKDCSHQEVTILDKPVLRAFRYARAMSACGQSRILELAHLVPYLDSVSGSLLDMMSGAGFVARYLGAPFQICHGLDVYEAPSAFQSPLSNVHVHDAGRPDIKSVLDYEYDAIISLAGFHHLLPAISNSTPCSADITAHRTQCLRQWRSLLKPGGRLVVADVPLQGYPASDFSPDRQDLTAFPELEKALATLSPYPGAEIQAFQPEPAYFFDQFISKESITPHISAFETPESLGSAMSEAGYINIRTGVHLAPWYFANLEEMVWFTLNLFGIGEKDFVSPDKVTKRIRTKILDAIQMYLGYWPTSDEGVWMGWKLLYVSVEKPA